MRYGLLGLSHGSNPNNTPSKQPAPLLSRLLYAAHQSTEPRMFFCQSFQFVLPMLPSRTLKDIVLHVGMTPDFTKNVLACF